MIHTICSGPGTVARHAAVALLTLLTCAALAGAQTTPDSGASGPPPDAGLAVQDAAEAGAVAAVRSVATVNGEVITSADISQNVRALRRGMPDAPIDELVSEARRILAEEILLAGEAARLGMLLSDEQVSSYWEQRFGEAPDFERIAAATGTTHERQISLARRAALAELYMLHKVGLRADQAQVVSVDPVLARMVAVTPRQLRDFFQRERPRFDTPATVSFTAYPQAGIAGARALRSALLAGEEPPAGTRAIPDTLYVDAVPQLFGEPLATFLQTAGLGAVSEPVTLEAGVLLLQLTGREMAKAADFRAVQKELEETIKLDRVMRAREALVGRLEEDAAYWPDDLFIRRVASPSQPP